MDDAIGYVPGFFESLLLGQYGPQDTQRILDGCAVRRAVTLRANTLIADAAAISRELDEAGIQWSAVNWYADAFVLPSAREDAVRKLPSYAQGGLYLQSLSSMIPALILNAQAGQDVCDMCAAPGGKTTQILALSRGGAMICACELHAPRAEKLEHNLRKLGAENVTVMRTDARQLDDFFSFDCILLDAPCSGSGTLDAHNPATRKHFTEKLIAKSVKTQKALIAKALKLLKPGGTLVYSTCSVLAAENEDIVEGALAHAKGGQFELKPIALDDAGQLPRIPTRLPETLLLAPTDLYEGFFVAKVKRTR